MSTQTTCAPASARRIAEARPLPMPSPAAPAPETMATRPARERAGRGNSSAMVGVFSIEGLRSIKWVVFTDCTMSQTYNALHVYVGG